MIDLKRIPSDEGGLFFCCSFCVINRVKKKRVIFFFEGEMVSTGAGFFGAIKKKVCHIFHNSEKGAVELMGIQFREWLRPVENGYNGGKKGKGKSKASKRMGKRSRAMGFVVAPDVFFKDAYR